MPECLIINQRLLILDYISIWQHPPTSLQLRKPPYVYSKNLLKNLCLALSRKVKKLSSCAKASHSYEEREPV